MPSRIVATSCEGSTSLSVISANHFTSQCLRRCSSVMTARICCGTRFSMRRLIFAALRITSQESGQQPPWHWLEPYLISHSTRYRIKLVTCVFQLNLNALAHRDNRLHDYPHIMIDRRLLVERYSGTTILCLCHLRMSFARTGTGTLLGARMPCYTSFGPVGISLTRPDL